MNIRHLLFRRTVKQTPAPARSLMRTRAEPVTWSQAISDTLADAADGWEATHDTEELRTRLLVALGLLEGRK